MYCGTCGQTMPTIERGNFVEYTANKKFFGVVHGVQGTRVIVTLLNGAFAGDTRDWPAAQCKVIHGYFHINRGKA